LSAKRLYAVSVSAGEPASLHDFERDGSLRVMVMRPGGYTVGQFAASAPRSWRPAW
jgi:hypothetical protein